MKLQKSMKASGERILAIFEGRDAAGKGGTIKRITAFLNPRNVKVVALSKPSDTEVTQWYFQRYVPHLPAAGELVLFDRSWYNRAMVEPVMGFCTDEQHKRFLKDVPLFEELLVKDGIKLFKFYFSVSKEEQDRRFNSRKTDLLKQYKLSPVDNLAQKYWDQYSVKKFQMLNESNRTIAPWTIIRSDNKKMARINCMKHILQQRRLHGQTSGKGTADRPGHRHLRHRRDQAHGEKPLRPRTAARLTWLQAAGLSARPGSSPAVRLLSGRTAIGSISLPPISSSSVVRRSCSAALVFRDHLGIDAEPDILLPGLIAGQAAETP